jgi:predicted RNA-binding protein Jag
MTDRPQDDSPETPPPVDDTLESPPAEDDFFDGAAAAATPSRDDAARPDDETRPPPSPELARQATEAAEAACARILQLMGFDARVLSVPGDPIRIEIQGPDAGRVIGRHGTTLGALQYLVSRIVGHGVSRTP